MHAVKMIHKYTTVLLLYGLNLPIMVLAFKSVKRQCPQAVKGTKFRANFYVGTVVLTKLKPSGLLEV